jgi:hypothetical protein
MPKALGLGGGGLHFFPGMNVQHDTIWESREENIRGGGKTFTSAYISLEACCRKGGGGRSNASIPHHHPISQLIRGYFNDDVAVILFLGVSLVGNPDPSYRPPPSPSPSPQPPVPKTITLNLKSLQPTQIDETLSPVKGTIRKAL